jgi:post-segregation antitoxin (ccd killing protein)
MRPGLPTNRTEVGSVELDRSLLDQAQTLGIDIPAALDTHLRQLVGKARAEQWLKENRRRSRMPTRFWPATVYGATASDSSDAMHRSSQPR